MTGRHFCSYFDDADGVDLVCVCGGRAVLVVDDVTGDAVLVPLAAEPAEHAIALSA